jgi:hypothetical protein
MGAKDVCNIFNTVKTLMKYITCILNISMFEKM